MRGITKNVCLFPVQPSGCLDKIVIYKNYVDYVNTIQSTMNFLLELNNKLTNKTSDFQKYNILPTGITYNQKIKDKYIVTGLYIQENIII